MSVTAKNLVQGCTVSGKVPLQLRQLEDSNGVFAHTSSMGTSKVFFRILLSSDSMRIFEWSMDNRIWYPTVGSLAAGIVPQVPKDQRVRQLLQSVSLHSSECVKIENSHHGDAFRCSPSTTCDR
jgi:hypothetical protein